MRHRPGVSSTLVVIIVVVVLVIAGVTIWYATRGSGTAQTSTENLNANQNTNAAAVVNGNQNSAVSPATAQNPNVLKASRAYDMQTVKAGDAVGTMTVQRVGKDVAGNFTINFTGEATVTGNVSYDSTQSGTGCDGVRMELTATSGEVLPKEKNVDQPTALCFMNTAEAKAAFEPFDQYVPNNNRKVVVIDQYFDTLSGDIPTARFVRKSTYDEQANWKTYTNANLHLTLKFPFSWEGYTVSTPSADAVTFTHPTAKINSSSSEKISFTITRISQGGTRPQYAELIDAFGGYDYVYSEKVPASGDVHYWTSLILAIRLTFQYIQ